MTKPRYRSIVRSSADIGYVIGIFNQLTGTCEQDDEGFDEVAELNRLYEENKQLRQTARSAIRDLKALAAEMHNFQKKTSGLKVPHEP